jgi:hypothetical protein
VQSLEHAEHDGADKGECDIRGNNAQFADEAHGKSPRFTSLPVVTRKLADCSRPKKSALLSIKRCPQQGTAGDVVKDS